MLEDGSLKIEGLLSEDAGLYQCVATNKYGTATVVNHLQMPAKR